MQQNSPPRKEKYGKQDIRNAGRRNNQGQDPAGNRRGSAVFVVQPNVLRGHFHEGNVRAVQVLQQRRRQGGFLRKLCGGSAEIRVYLGGSQWIGYISRTART